MVRGACVAETKVGPLLPLEGYGYRQSTETRRLFLIIARAPERHRACVELLWSVLDHRPSVTVKQKPTFACNKAILNARAPKISGRVRSWAFFFPC